MKLESLKISNGESSMMTFIFQVSTIVTPVNNTYIYKIEYILHNFVKL